MEETPVSIYEEFESLKYPNHLSRLVSTLRSLLKWKNKPKKGKLTSNVTEIGPQKHENDCYKSQAMQRSYSTFMIR